MLTVTEDLLLLVLQKYSGRFRKHSAEILRHTLVGSALLDLELTDRIDTDLEHLEVVDPTPTGKAFLDPLLEEIANSEKSRDLWDWLQTLSPTMGDAIRDSAVESLIGQGILERQGSSRSPRYQLVGDAGPTDARERIEKVLFSEDEIPTPQEVALICLADACDLLRALFRKKRIKAALPRLQQIRKMELVGGGTVAHLALLSLERSAL